MKEAVVEGILHEHDFSEYCAVVRCSWCAAWRNDGGDGWAACDALAYYTWLKSNGYRIIRSSVEKGATS